MKGNVLNVMQAALDGEGDWEPQMVRAIAGTAELLEVTSSQVSYAKRVGYCLFLPNGKALTGKTHQFVSGALAEKEEATFRALQQCGVQP